MNWNGLFTRRQFDVPCQIEVVNTFESLRADLRLQDGVTVNPGDEVLVHGEPVVVPYGERGVFDRMATVTRASWIYRQWVRMTGDLEFMELCEFSFSERAVL